MLKIIRNLLLQIIDDIDSGNSNISEKELLEAIEFIQRILSKELSKIEVAEYIGVSRATFDNYIRKGILPLGKDRDSKRNLGINKILIIL